MVEKGKPTDRANGDRVDGAVGSAIASIIIAVVLLAIAAALATPIYFLVRSAYNQGHLIFGEPTTQAVAVKAGETQGFRRGDAGQDAVFTYVVDGKTYRRSLDGTTGDQKGDRETVHYDPANPQDATIELSVAGYIFLTAFKAAGCAILGFLIYYFLRGWRKMVFGSSNSSRGSSQAKSGSRA